MLYEWAFCSHTPSVIGKCISRHPKLVLLSDKNFTNCHTAKNAKNSNFSSSNCCNSNFLTRTKATGLPVTLNYRTASRFEDRLDSHIRRFLQMLVLFAVLLVDCEEWFYILVESLPYVRRAISCILFSLQQNQVVDFTVVEHRLDSILESNASSFEFSQFLSRRINDSPKQFCHVA